MLRRPTTTPLESTKPSQFSSVYPHRSSDSNPSKQLPALCLQASFQADRFIFTPLLSKKPSIKHNIIIHKYSIFQESEVIASSPFFFLFFSSFLRQYMTFCTYSYLKYIFLNGPLDLKYLFINSSYVLSQYSSIAESESIR